MFARPPLSQGCSLHRASHSATSCQKSTGVLGGRAHSLTSKHSSRGVSNLAALWFGTPSSPNLLRRLACRRRCGGLLIHRAEFLPQLHQLPEFLKAWRCGASRRWRSCRGCLSASCVTSRGAGPQHNVEPRVARDGHQDVLIERQLIQLLIACDPDVVSDPFPE
jgi:hypothetical protein